MKLKEILLLVNQTQKVLIIEKNTKRTITKQEAGYLLSNTLNSIQDERNFDREVVKIRCTSDSIAFWIE